MGASVGWTDELKVTEVKNSMNEGTDMFEGIES